jgi:O-antigen ligase
VIAGRSVDRRSVTSLLIALLILLEVLLGLLVAVSPEHSNLILVAAIGLMVTVATFIKPVFGLYLLIAAMFAENMLRLGSVSSARLIMPLTFGAWAVHSLSARQFKVRMPLQFWFALAFVVWGLLSALWAIDTGKILSAAQTLIQGIGLYFLVVNLIDTPGKMKRVVLIVVAASLVVASLAMFYAVTREFSGGRVEIAAIFGTGPHTLAGYLVPGVALLMVLFSRERHVARKLFFLAGLLATVVAVLATGTRAAVFALIGVAIVGLMLDRTLWQAVLPGVLVGAWGSAFFLAPAVQQRFLSLLTTYDRGSGRLDIWLVAMNIIRAHPILGTGLDTFGRAFDRYVGDTPGLEILHVVQGWGSHNVYINIQAELGIIGLVLFVSIVGMSVRDGLTAIANLKRARDYHMTTLALGTWLGLLGMLLMGLFLDWQYAKYLWLLFGLVEVGRRLSTQAYR